MDKLAYHFNKKKKPAKTEGKFLYYYPCDEEDNPNAWFGNKSYIVIEVTQAEWETLFELDRLEYNNTHKYQRHTNRFSNKDEDDLTPKQQQKRINKDTPFSEIVDEQVDRQILLSRLPLQDKKILELSEDKTQSSLAAELGVTQGYISSSIKKANRAVDEYIFKTGTRDEIVWHCWNTFVDKGKMPYFIDVEIEFVIRGLLNDMLPFYHWYYSVGELCRFILKYYLFDNDKMDDEIAEYLSTASEEERIHFVDYYGEQPPIIGAVYLRLCKEMKRRQDIRLQDLDKLYNNLYDTVDKLARRLKTTVYDFMTKRFYPFIAKHRRKRLQDFYKAYSGKRLPN